MKMNMRTSAAIVWLPAASVTATALFLLAIRSRLPESVATHWGPGGSPDGFTDAGVLPVVAGGIMLAVGGLMAAIAAAGRHAPVGRRLILGLPLGMVWFLGGLIGSLTAVQIDTTSPPDLPVWAIPFAFGLGAAGWLLGSALGTTDPIETTAGPAPPDADCVALADGHTLVWSGTTPPARAIPILALAVVVLGLVIGFLTTWAVALIFLPVLALLIGSSIYRVTAGPARVQAAGILFGFPRVRVSLEQITAAEAGTVEAWNFGGWGIRSSLGKESAVITRSGPALVITRTDGAVLRISLDEPEEPAAIISTLLDRRSA